MKHYKEVKNPSPKKTQSKILPFSYPIVSIDKLRVPLHQSDTLFLETLSSRRSERNFRKLKKRQLSDLLYYSARTVKINGTKDGNLWFQRPSPSAGGLHPIDIIVCIPKKDDYSINYYNPIDHSLNRLKLDTGLVANFVKHINEIIPTHNKSTILWLVAHEYRTATKYINPTSLVWRDAGCLLFCINLVSTALNMRCCILGSLGEPNISRLFKKFGDVYGIGGCLIG